MYINVLYLAICVDIFILNPLRVQKDEEVFEKRLDVLMKTL